MTVVVAYTPDPFGEAALDAGLAEAKDRGEPLVLVNASRGDAYVDKAFAGEEQLAALQRRVEGSGVEVEIRQAVVADVAGAIVDTAVELAARLIVVGVRHRSPVGKAIMGSVAQQVILDSPVPVLSVKPLR